MALRIPKEGEKAKGAKGEKEKDFGPRTPHHLRANAGKGTLTLQSKVQGPKSKVENSLESEAEGYFQKAIEIARRQQAKSLELRVAMSLSRLWQQQGKKEEARQMLAEVYGWFTEGFDTKDLQEAKALLDSLGSSVQRHKISGEMTQ